MPKPERKTPDKFRVGQKVIFATVDLRDWERANGEQAVIVEPKRVVDIWCSDLDGSNRNFQRGTERYLVRWREGDTYIRECHLRPIYDGEKLSTWEKFAKATGIDLPGSCLVAKPVPQRRRQAERAS